MDINGSARSPAPNITNRHSDVSSIGSSDAGICQMASSLQTDSDEHLSDGSPTTPRTGISEQINIINKHNADHSILSNKQDSSSALSVAASSELDTIERLWEPFWLSTPVLVAFAFVFSMIILATALLYQFSEKHRGIAIQEQDNYYMWKYGPMAVFIVINAFWRQVEVTNEISMPWKELRAEPNSFKKALLLDYISPISPVSLWMGLKNKHWSVALSILGHILILAAAVASTSLLNLEPTLMTREWTEFHQKSEFRLLEGWNQGWQPVGPQAAYIYHGIHEMDLRYPSGTSEDVVIPTIEVANHSSDILDYTTHTEGLKIKFECQAPSVTNVTRVYPTPLDQSDIWDLAFTAVVETPGCVVTNVPVAFRPGLRPLDLKDHAIAKATQDYSTKFWWYTCNNGSGFRNGETRYAPTNESATGLRLLAAVADLTFSPFNEDLGRYEDAELNKLTVTVCKPSYFISLFDVGKPDPVDGSAQAKLSANLNVPRKQLSGLPDSALGAAVFNVIFESVLSTYSFEASLFSLLRSKNHQSPVSAFLDSDLLIKTSSEVLQGVAAQFLRLVAVQPSAKNLTGQITCREERLKVTTYSMGFICGFCGLLVIISLALIFIRPCSTIPMVPDSIASMAYILASDTVFKKTLIHQQLSSRLPGSQWRGKAPCLNSGFSRKSSDVPGSSNSSKTEEYELACPSIQNEDSGTTSWWHPMASSNWFFALATGLPLSIIATLQILQHFSQMNNGLIDLQTISTPVLSTYIPVIIALGISGLYSSTEFIVVLFTPFVTLKRSDAITFRALNFSPFGKLLPQTLYLSFKSRHYAAMLAILASLVGSFLNIVTSGLYTTIDSPRYLHVPVTQTDTFNSTMNNDKFDLAFEVSSLIEFRGMQFPKWTYEELVFNGWSKPSLPLDVEGQAKHLTAVVPAIRPRLNCTEVVNTKWISGQGLTATLVVRDWCDALPTANISRTVLHQGYYSTFRRGQEEYVGRVDNTASVFYSLFRDNKDHGCPTISVTLGLVRAPNNTLRKNGTEHDAELDVTLLLCHQLIEQVNTELSLRLPGLVLDEGRPPVPDESSVKLLVNPNGSSKFPHEMGNLIDRISSAAPTVFQEASGNVTAADTNPVILTLTHGRSGRPIEELAGKKNARNLANALNAVYGRYMAQALSMTMRIQNDANTLSPEAYDGVVELDGPKRLYQNNTSKLVIQIMLGVMIICAVAVKLLLPTREVLLHNPCSIHGITSMLIDGSLVSKETVSSAQNWKGNSKDLLERVYGGKTYTLKWWTSRDGKKWYGIDVDKKCTDEPCKKD